MPGMVLGDIASRHCFTWLLNLPTWGLMWMGRQMRGQSLLPGAILSHHCSGAMELFGGCEAPGLGYLVEY
jgi:hypothetical protein